MTESFIIVNLSVMGMSYMYGELISYSDVQSKNDSGCGLIPHLSRKKTTSHSIGQDLDLNYGLYATFPIANIVI